MTHNVWRKDDNMPAWEEKGYDCSAVARIKGHLRVYSETLPDIIGYQEMSPRMADPTSPNVLLRITKSIRMQRGNIRSKC